MPEQLDRAFADAGQIRGHGPGLGAYDEVIGRDRAPDALQDSRNPYFRRGRDVARTDTLKLTCSNTPSTPGPAVAKRLPGAERTEVVIGQTSLSGSPVESGPDGTVRPVKFLHRHRDQDPFEAGHNVNPANAIARTPYLARRLGPSDAAGAARRSLRGLAAPQPLRNRRSARTKPWSLRQRSRLACRWSLQTSTRRTSPIANREMATNSSLIPIWSSSSGSPW